MTPDYVELTRFLMEPLLDSPEDLKVYTEVLSGGSKVWVRVALEGDNDRGRFFGRGGRNIQAIRNILKAAGQNAAQQVTLEVFGSDPEKEEGRSPSRSPNQSPHKPHSKPRRPGQSGTESPEPSSDSPRPRPRKPIKLKRKSDESE